jgi:hypothetical protein
MADHRHILPADHMKAPHQGAADPLVPVVVLQSHRDPQAVLQVAHQVDHHLVVPPEEDADNCSCFRLDFKKFIPMRNDTGKVI